LEETAKTGEIPWGFKAEFDGWARFGNSAELF
jgi:hypothetical protein